MDVTQIVKLQKNFFATQKTKNVDFRLNALKKLLYEVEKREDEIVQAIHLDFKKSAYETIMTETSIVIGELKLAIKKLKKWSKPNKVLPSILNFPSSAKIISEPYGNTLIIAPWNYPYQLAIAPLIGALAAGNTAVLKPSELTPNTSSLIKSIIEDIFDPAYVCVIEGGVPITQELLANRWDYIFFTGSVKVGKIIAKAAAEHLTPTTLELGGKNPCIIDASANIELTAKRLVWGKCVNAGQTCIAPDYWLVHSSVKDKLVQQFKKEIQNAYGDNPETSEDYPRIVNSRNFERLNEMLSDEHIIVGGQTNAKEKYIAPTLIENPSLDSKVMEDEIFGPISAIITYKEESEIEKIINRYEKPLALYVFSSKMKFAKRIIEKYSFGGGTINDTMVHFVNKRLPFGGVGHSGLGSYHGKLSFDVFSHQKSIVKRGTWLDIPTRYAPYKGKLKQLRTLMKIS